MVKLNRDFRRSYSQSLSLKTGDLCISYISSSCKRRTCAVCGVCGTCFDGAMFYSQHVFSSLMVIFFSNHPTPHHIYIPLNPFSFPFLNFPRPFFHFQLHFFVVSSSPSEFRHRHARVCHLARGWSAHQRAAAGFRGASENTRLKKARGGDIYIFLWIFFGRERVRKKRPWFKS